jgi:CRP-like cAMP-binding protein
VLKKVNIFTGQSEEFYMAIVSMVKQVEYNAKEVIAREGTRPLECYIVFKGKIVRINLYC